MTVAVAVFRCRWALQCDRIYDKRKAAVLELQRHVGVLAEDEKWSSIVGIIKLLHVDFIFGNNPNGRKGGLIGLAAVAIASEGQWPVSPGLCGIAI